MTRALDVAVRRAVLLVALAGCVENGGGPGRFGEVRVEPAYRAGYEPDAIGVAIDSANVVVLRHGTAQRLIDRRVPYAGGSLAWVLDLEADEESLDVEVELWSGGARRYAGDTAVVVQSGAVASDEPHALAMAYVGPAIVKTVSVTPATDTLRAPGATRQFTAEARDPDGNVVSGATFAWATSDATVATVDAATGLATAVANGSTTISAASGSVTATATLAVRLPPVVAVVIVTPASAALAALGATQQFSAEARDGNGNVLPGVTFTWGSSASAVATVDASGLATATGHGSTSITATSGTVSGSATLDVSLAASVATIVVTPAGATLTALGATQQFSAEARDANGHVLPGVTFSWGSSAAAVATVDAAGLATATGHGSTSITATSGAVSGSATLDVNLAATVASVIVTPSTATLTALAATQQFVAEAHDANGHVLPGVTFSWGSSATAVATVDAAGLATATGHGSTTITATAGSVGGSATLDVNLAVSVATVVVTPANAALAALAATQQFVAEAHDANGHVLPGVTFSWGSSAAAVATVDAAGLATATGHGSTTITATAGSVGGSATLDVNLAVSVATVAVTPANATLAALGATQQFSAEARDANGHVLPGVTFSWGSSATAVATVDAAGLATATGHGSTTITATSGAVSGSATLNVNLAATVASVIVTPSSAALAALGATQRFTAEARDAGNNVVPGVSFTWATSAAAVATVDAAGLATATGHGSTTITATSGSVSGSATLDVSLAASVATIVVTPASAALAALGATQQFSAEARDGNGHVLPGVTFTWGSSATAVATVSATGQATATGHGSTTITATSGAVSGSATLNVNLAATVASVIVTPANAALAALGATQQFTAEARDAGNNVVPGVTFTWGTSAAAVATVSSTGLATATGNGSATITAEVVGVQGSAAVTVSQSVTAILITPDSATLVLSPEGSALPARSPSPPPVQQFVAVAVDANGNEVVGAVFNWASSVTEVATVDNTGLATAISRGATTISASVNGVTGTAKLVVK